MSDGRVRVDERKVQDWAEQVLQEWLTGYTYEPGQFQYKIDYIGNDVFEVSGTYPHSDLLSRRFEVRVSVTAL